MESAHCLLPKVPSPTLSAASKGEQKPSPVNGETPKNQETRDEGQAAVSPLRTAKRRRTENAADISEFTHESVSVREPTSLGSVPLAKEEVHQKVATSEAGKVLFCGVLNLFIFPPSSQHLLSQVLLRSSAHRTPYPVF
jgi:E3 ubiquitin-protein ligase RBBP6